MDDCQTECCRSPLTPVVLHTVSGDSATAVPQWATERLHHARTALFCTVLSGQRPSPALLCHSQSSGCVTLRAQAVSLSGLRLCHSQSSGCVTLRAQELCESRGGRPELPVPNSPYGLCGRKSTLNGLNLAVSGLRSCVPV